MVNVRIHFTGLCAFIPQKAIDQANNEATVALVDASQSHHAPHYCLCLAQPAVFPKELAPNVLNRQIDLAFRYQAELGVFHWVNGCRLYKEQLTLVGRTAEGVEVPLAADSLKFNHDDLTHCPDEDSQHSFRWVASMEDADAGKVKSDVVNAADGGGLLGVRMKLTQGTVTTWAFRTTRDGIVRWDYADNDSVLAEEVAWEVAINHPDVVEVVLKSSSMGANRDSVVLRPDNGWVVAWIVNMPLDSLMDGFEEVDPTAPNTHFEELFRLADGDPPAEFPEPNGEYCEAGAGASNPKCPPAVFTALT